MFKKALLLAVFSMPSFLIASEVIKEEEINLEEKKSSLLVSKQADDKPDNPIAVRILQRLSSDAARELALSHLKEMPLGEWKRFVPSINSLLQDINYRENIEKILKAFFLKFSKEKLSSTKMESCVEEVQILLKGIKDDHRRTNIICTFLGTENKYEFVRYAQALIDRIEHEENREKAITTFSKTPLAWRKNIVELAQKFPCHNNEEYRLDVLSYFVDIAKADVANPYFDEGLLFCLGQPQEKWETFFTAVVPNIKDIEDKKKRTRVVSFFSHIENLNILIDEYIPFLIKKEKTMETTKEELFFPGLSLQELDFFIQPIISPIKKEKTRRKVLFSVFALNLELDGLSRLIKSLSKEKVRFSPVLIKDKNSIEKQQKEHLFSCAIEPLIKDLKGKKRAEVLFSLFDNIHYLENFEKFSSAIEPLIKDLAGENRVKVLCSFFKNVHLLENIEKFSTAVGQHLTDLQDKNRVNVLCSFFENICPLLEKGSSVSLDDFFEETTSLVEGMNEGDKANVLSSFFKEVYPYLESEEPLSLNDFFENVNLMTFGMNEGDKATVLCSLLKDGCLKDFEKSFDLIEEHIIGNMKARKFFSQVKEIPLVKRLIKPSEKEKKRAKKQEKKRVRVISFSLKRNPKQLESIIHLCTGRFSTLDSEGLDTFIKTYMQDIEDEGNIKNLVSSFLKMKKETRKTFFEYMKTYASGMKFKENVVDVTSSFFDAQDDWGDFQKYAETFAKDIPDETQRRGILSCFFDVEEKTRGDFIEQGRELVSVLKDKSSRMKTLQILTRVKKEEMPQFVELARNFMILVSDDKVFNESIDFFSGIKPEERAEVLRSVRNLSLVLMKRGHIFNELVPSFIKMDKDKRAKSIDFINDLLNVRANEKNCREIIFCLPQFDMTDFTNPLLLTQVNALSEWIDEDHYREAISAFLDFKKDQREVCLTSLNTLIKGMIKRQQRNIISAFLKMSQKSSVQAHFNIMKKYLDEVRADPSLISSFGRIEESHLSEIDGYIGEIKRGIKRDSQEADLSSSKKEKDKDKKSKKDKEKKPKKVKPLHGIKKWKNLSKIVDALSRTSLGNLKEYFNTIGNLAGEMKNEGILTESFCSILKLSPLELKPFSKQVVLLTQDVKAMPAQLQKVICCLSTVDEDVREKVVSFTSKVKKPGVRVEVISAFSKVNPANFKKIKSFLEGEKQTFWGVLIPFLETIEDGDTFVDQVIPLLEGVKDISSRQNIIKCFLTCNVKERKSLVKEVESLSQHLMNQENCQRLMSALLSIKDKEERKTFSNDVKAVVEGLADDVLYKDVVDYFIKIEADRREIIVKRLKTMTKGINLVYKKQIVEALLKIKPEQLDAVFEKGMKIKTRKKEQKGEEIVEIFKASVV